MHASVSVCMFMLLLYNHKNLNVCFVAMCARAQVNVYVELDSN